jgi:4-diphosphocytidyl-2-C-methyl-D-erythritol kinase
MPISPISHYPEAVDLPDGGFALSSPAKVNLYLHIRGRRSDGFHELDTIFQEISWCDTIEFHPAPSWSFEVDGLQLDTGPENLVVRAARRLAEQAQVPLRGRVILHKQIPIGGGLGGGSSNAAMTLIGLSRLWSLNWTTAQWHPLAAEIGSDCAFFLYGGTARGTGRGEQIEVLEEAPEMDLLVVVPPFSVSTAWAYQAGQFPLTDYEKSVILQFYPKNKFDPPFLAQNFYNDLENIVLQRYSDLALIKQSLLDHGAKVSMLSGSGSCMFAIFEERSRALHAAQQFGSPYTVRVCRTVHRPR